MEERDLNWGGGLEMPCVEKFRESLEKFQVKDEIVHRINEGYEELVSSSPKVKKAAFFKRAMDIMDEQVEEEQKKEILGWNACCKSGSREKASKAFAKKYKDCSLEEKLAKVSEVPYMGWAEKNEDGNITVHAVEYWDGSQYMCGCSNFNKVKREDPVSKSYCYCCAGHFKYHYETMLGVKLHTLEILSSPLDSNGKNPCVMRFEIVR